MSNVWQAKVQINEADHFIYDEILSNLEAGIDVSKHNENWFLTAYIEEHFAEAHIRETFANIAGIVGNENALELESIPQEDWKESMKHSFPPLSVGSFFIHSFEEDVPEDMLELKIPAGLAFGTGEHPTTEACLTLYEDLADETTFTNVLDMGCGSAILAMATVKKQGSTCVAVDIDPDSVTTANHNLELNACEKNITCAYSNGFGSDVVQQSAPYQLILANILANPLIEMSEHLINALENNAVAIISGFTEDQKEKVIDAYTSKGLKLLSEIQIGEWVAASLVKA